MEPKFRRIMAIIDPTRTEQWALNKALSLAATTRGAEVIAYACVHSAMNTKDLEDLKRAEIARYELWIDRMLEEARTDGVHLRHHIAWDRDWRESVQYAAEQLEADLVIKRADNQTRALGNSDRRLLRTVACNVLLVNREPRQQTRKVLIAVNPRPSDDAHRELEEQVVEMGRFIADSHGDIELHAICAYPDALHFVEPSEIANQVGIDLSRAHVMEATPQKAIATTAEELDTDVLIMGAMANKGVAGFTFGHTAEKLLNSLRSDVLVVARHEA